MICCGFSIIIPRNELGNASTSRRARYQRRQRRHRSRSGHRRHPHRQGRRPAWVPIARSFSARAPLAAHKTEILAALADHDALRATGPDAIRERVLAKWSALRKARFGAEPDPCLEAEKDFAELLTKARRLIEQLAAVGVRPALDQGGALVLIDEQRPETGRGRDLARFIAMDRAFTILAKGLELDPALVGTIDFEGAPPGCSSRQWRIAVNGRDCFVIEGWANEALKAGWTEDELFAPEHWGRIDRCGVAWLIGERRVVEATTDAITIATECGSRLSFYRRRA
jgi:hypothetical protein